VLLQRRDRAHGEGDGVRSGRQAAPPDGGGLRQGERIEIVKGLNAGEQLVIQALTCCAIEPITLTKAAEKKG
jgi:hypothetical protein